MTEFKVGDVIYTDKWGPKVFCTVTTWEDFVENSTRTIKPPREDYNGVFVRYSDGRVTCLPDKTLKAGEYRLLTPLEKAML
jgi:hypothetical protein